MNRIILIGNGFDLADRMRKWRPDLPVILCSGYAHDRLKGPLLEERCYRFLAKPYTRIQALFLVREVLRGVPMAYRKAVASPRRVL